jgi:uncharacterized protein YndB with AHSA1/START domain
MSRHIFAVDPKLDLVLERVVPVPRELVWKAWTTPEILMKWFTPAPWSTVECEIDLRPGGLFRTVMRSPEGQTYPHDGCYLEVIPNERLVWTDALLPGFRPANRPGEPSTTCGVTCFTAVISLATEGTGTKYTALALHKDEADSKGHAAMGFYDGWGTALDQLVDVVRKL